MLFILNIIKNNHAQGENTKESIFALLCLQLFISSRTHVKPRMRFSQSIYISLRLRLRKETKYSNYFSKNMNSRDKMFLPSQNHQSKLQPSRRFLRYPAV